MDGWEAVGAVCGRALPGASRCPIHSYLHVEPCNYQASSAGAKLLVMGSQDWRQSTNGRAEQAAGAAIDQWEASIVAGILCHGCSGCGACGQVVCSLLNKPISGRDALLVR